MFKPSQVYSRRVKGEASRRVAFGEMAEMLVCERFGAARLHTGAAVAGDSCPDVRLPNGRVAEVKSTRDRRIVVYAFRLRKELAKHGPSYPYFVVHHGQRGTTDVGRFFAEAEVWCLTLEDVLRAVEGRTPRQLVSRGGYHRNGYEEGYFDLRLSRIVFPFERRTTLFLTSGAF